MYRAHRVRVVPIQQATRSLWFGGRLTAWYARSLRESAFEGIWVEGLHHIYVPNAMCAVELLRQGMLARAVACTGMNQHSSRSHCVFSLRVEQQHPDGYVQRGELHFADLAGLERVDRTGAHGQSLEEAKRINLSLSALGNCISALAQPGEATYTRTHAHAHIHTHTRARAHTHLASPQMTHKEKK